MATTPVLTGRASPFDFEQAFFPDYGEFSDYATYFKWCRAGNHIPVASDIFARRRARAPSSPTLQTAKQKQNNIHLADPATMLIAQQHLLYKFGVFHSADHELTDVGETLGLTLVGRTIVVPDRFWGEWVIARQQKVYAGFHEMGALAPAPAAQGYAEYLQSCTQIPYSHAQWEHLRAQRRPPTAPS